MQRKTCVVAQCALQQVHCSSLSNTSTAVSDFSDETSGQFYTVLLTPLHQPPYSNWSAMLVTKRKQQFYIA